MIRAFIIATAGEFTDTQREVAEELIQATLEQHVADQRRYGIDVARAKALAISSGAAANSAGNMVDAGQTTGPDNPALLDTANQAGGNPAGAGTPLSTKPAYSPDDLASEEEASPRRDAVVAWDLTLRCPVCNSTVEGRRNNYRCYTCERRGR
jgi:hypothetical protein